jgi:hypothetical protein
MRDRRGVLWLTVPIFGDYRSLQRAHQLISLVLAKHTQIDHACLSPGGRRIRKTYAHLLAPARCVPVST